MAGRAALRSTPLSRARSIQREELSLIGPPWVSAHFIEQPVHAAPQAMHLIDEVQDH
jgi:hypothetical protein